MRELRVPKVSPVAIIQSRWALNGSPWLSRCTACTPMVLRCPMDNPCALSWLLMLPGFSAVVPVVVDSSSYLIPATTAGTPINLVYSSKTSPPHSVRCRKFAPHFLALNAETLASPLDSGALPAKENAEECMGAYTPRRRPHPELRVHCQRLEKRSRLSRRLAPPLTSGSPPASEEHLKQVWS